MKQHYNNKDPEEATHRTKAKVDDGSSAASTRNTQRHNEMSISNFRFSQWGIL